MNDWRKIIALVGGIILVVIQSFFLILGLTIIWAFIVSWTIKKPWWLLFLIGFFTDIFYLYPIGRTSLILIVIGLATKHFTTIFGFRENYKMKVSRL